MRHLGAEDDILDEDTFNGHTPLVSNVPDNFGDLKGNSLALGDDTLYGARAYDMTERSLSTFNERLAEICDAECCSVGVANLEVDDRVNFDVDVITSDDCLSSDWANLNLDVDDAQRFSADIDLNQTGVDRLVELSKARHKTDRALLDIAERIGEGAAWDHPTNTNHRAKSLQQRAVKSMGNLSSSQILGIRRLHLASLQWLYGNHVGLVCSSHPSCSSIGSMMIHNVSVRGSGGSGRGNAGLGINSVVRHGGLGIVEDE